MAAIRRQPCFTVGNLMVPDVFNVQGVLGASGALKPVSAQGDLLRGCWIMIALVLLMIPLLFTGRRLHSAEGLVLLAGHAAHISPGGLRRPGSEALLAGPSLHWKGEERGRHPPDRPNPTRRPCRATGESPPRPSQANAASSATRA